jgi:hypothetical protein
MLEYVFFDERPLTQFVDFLEDKGLQPQRGDDEGMFKVMLPEDLEEELAEQIEDRYDELMEMSREIYEQEADADDVGYHAAGVTVQLAGGVNVYAQVDPRLLGRIMEVLTPEEFNEVVNAIAEAVEHPDTRSMCQRMRDAEGGEG